MSLVTNQIKEIYPDVYWVLLWCPESNILHHLLDPKQPYVLCWDHNVGNYTWTDFSLPIFNPREPKKVLSRLARFDFIMETKEFIDVLPFLEPRIKAVQLGSLPPYYLDMGRIKGKERYRILKECGWHVLLDTPANDYGVVMSPKRDVLEDAIRLVNSE